MSVERAGILLSAVAVYGQFRCGVERFSKLQGLAYMFVMAINDLLGVIYATVANF